MKITVLDGYGVNPGDVSWEQIERLGELTVYDRTSSDLVIERIGDSDAIFLNKIQINEEILSHCPNLKYIGVLATGYNVVDVKVCAKRKITVTNIPAYSTNAVAQHVFAFILNFTNLVEIHSQSVHSGGWIKNPDFCYWLKPLSELAGKTIGIFGFGNIGKKVAEIAHAFGMNVIVKTHGNKPAENEKTVSKEELFSLSDYLTLHAPLTNETANLVNKEMLSLMKKSAILINTARGGLVDEAALREALDNEKISGYATDVLVNEPMSSDCPLYNAPSCVITPHMAWAPKETRQRLLKIAAENLIAFINGQKLNTVS